MTSPLLHETFKVVYNSKCGGFDLSKKALDAYNHLASKNLKYADCIDDRSDPFLIELVETMEKK